LKSICKMDPKELRGLYEAYAEVYVPQEVDEAVKGASRHDTEMRKAASTERKAGVKNRLSPAAGKDNADKMQRDVKFFDKLTKKNRNVVGLVTKEEVEQIDELSVNKMNAYINKAEKDRGRLNKKWDQGTATSKERKKVFDREEGEARASKKIRQKTGKDSFRLNALDKLKSAITKEDFDIFDTVLEFLQVEGYAETLEEAEWLMANRIDEQAIEIILGEEQLDEIDSSIIARTAHKRKQNLDAAQKKEMGSRDDGATMGEISRRADETSAASAKVSKHRALSTAHARSRSRMNKEEYVDEAITSEKGKAKAAEMIAARSTPSGRAKSGKGANVAQIRNIGRSNREGLGGTPMTPTMAKNPVKKKNYDGTGNRAARRAGTYQEEFVGEAQEARNNPEKYEREQSKKSAPVRGEKTPMPPRGDKRREDFEKWYAANVR
jgi:hypothetical protein